MRDPVGPGDIAQKLGVERETVHTWRERESTRFPAPATKVGNTPVWNWPDVEAWARETGRIE